MGSHSGRDAKRVSSRRNFLILGGALVLMAGWRSIAPKLDDLFAGDIEFSPIDGLDGFRKIGRGAMSAAAIDPFFGIGNDPIETVPLKGSLSANLHFAVGSGVRVAEFTDYNCPYCKILGERVHKLRDEGAISVSLHHLPLLGPGSVAASLVTLAAGKQRKTDALHRRIMAARFRVDENYAIAIAQDQGFNVADFNLNEGLPHIARSKALARRFGIIGTPALVVGRTLVTGEISERRLRELVEIERQDL